MLYRRNCGIQTMINLLNQPTSTPTNACTDAP
jgi:hypothetical protein